MQSNVPMTPQIATIGAAIAQAVLAVLADPKAASESAKLVDDARMLTEAEAAKASEDRELMARADELREEMKRREDNVNSLADINTAVKAKLNAAYDVHTANVEALLASEKILAEDQKKHEEDVKQLKAQKDAFANEWKELLNSQEQNRKWEATLERREKALTGAAAQIAGKAATG